MTLAPAQTSLSQRVDTVLANFLDRQPEVLQPLVELARAFILNGGKRLRPTLCYWAWRGSTDSAEDSQVIQAGAALEMFHSFALIHDDIIDRSTLRRGQPTLHESHGHDIALLCGDLCALWAEQLFDIPVPQARQLFTAMRAEAVAGEYLDIVAHPTVERALEVVHWKTTRYSIMRPLQIGAVLAGANQSIVDGYAAVAGPLGEAFQLRDDILGVFGDPAVTGKSNLDDLRQAKPTVLLALTEGHVPDARVMIECGALAATEDRIERALAAALEALDEMDIAGQAKDALRRLAVFAAQRAT